MLRRTQATVPDDTPDWEPWAQFFLRALPRQKTRLEEKVAREQGRVTVGQIEMLTSESRSTLKSRLSALVRAGLLVRHGQGRATWHTLP